jgi:hypothetical protein
LLLPKQCVIADKAKRKGSIGIFVSKVALAPKPMPASIFKKITRVALTSAIMAHVNKPKVETFS